MAQVRDAVVEGLDESGSSANGAGDDSKKGLDCDIKIRHPQVSAVHARLYSEKGLFYIEDLGSANGTYVRGARLPKGQRMVVGNGEKIYIGPMPYVVELDLGPGDWSKTIGREGPDQIAPATLDNCLKVTRTAVPGGDDIVEIVVDSPFPKYRRVLIGRNPNCDIVLLGEDISDFHAVLQKGDEVFYLEDLGSKAGTTVGGERLTPGVKFRLLSTTQKEIRIGSTPMRMDEVPATRAHTKLYFG